MSGISVWVADIGSVKRNRFGWCRLVRRKSGFDYGVGTNIEEFAQGIANDLNDGIRVALGFECPLFVPVAAVPASLTDARCGEGSRAWSAGAGTGALATGLVQCVWVFETVFKSAKVSIQPTLHWQQFTSGKANLFIWEAFVSGEAKVGTHSDDARVVAQCFWDGYPNIEQATAVTADNPFSLVGAALLRAGLTEDLSLLSTPCVVIRA